MGDRRQLLGKVPWKRMKKPALGVLGRLLQLAIIMAVLIPVLIAIHSADIPPSTLNEDTAYDFQTNRSQLQDLTAWDPNFENGSWNVYAEMHAHTTESDGSLSPEQVVEWALAYAFNVIVVSDHNTITGGLKAEAYAQSKYNGTLLVIPAVEYSCCRIHMNLVGINETLAPEGAWPTDEQMQQVINRTHALGGVVIVNHIPWSNSTEYGYEVPTLPRHPSREQLTAWGVDGYESLHGSTLDLASLRYSTEHGMPLLSSTDLHTPSTVPNGWTITKLDGNITKESFIDKLKSGNTSFLYDAWGAPTLSYPPDNPAYDKWAALLSVDFSFLYTEQRGMYSFTGEFCQEHRLELKRARIGWFVLWIVVAWVFYEVGRALAIFAWRPLLWVWSRRKNGRVRLLDDTSADSPSITSATST